MSSWQIWYPGKSREIFYTKIWNLLLFSASKSLEEWKKKSQLLLVILAIEEDKSPISP